MIISRRHRFVFLRTRQTDCARGEVALSPLCGPDDMLRPLEPSYELLRRDLGIVPRHYARWPFALLTGTPFNVHGPARRPSRGRDHWGLRRFPPFPSARMVARALGPRLWSESLSFAVARDPLDRLAHAYDDALAAGRCADVAPFFAAGLPLPNAAVFGDRGELAIDGLLRFDHLAEDLATVCTRLGLDHRGWLPRSTQADRASRQPWWAVFTDAQIEHAVRFYADDYRIMAGLGIAVPDAVRAILGDGFEASGEGGMERRQPAVHVRRDGVLEQGHGQVVEGPAGIG